MNDRQAFALAHPLGDQGLDRSVLKLYRRIKDHKRGLLMTILAVDR